MGRIVWGIVLVGIGALFLGQNYGVFEGNIGTVLVQWWPIILIVIGLSVVAEASKSLLIKIIVVFLTYNTIFKKYQQIYFRSNYTLKRVNGLI